MSRKLLHVLSVAAVAAAFLVATHDARAQSSGAAAAEVLFEQARKAMDAKDYDTACQRFRESNRLDPAHGTVLNLAVCEESRGNLATAWELFRAVYEKLPPTDQRRDFAKEHADALEPRLPRVTFELAAGAPSETVVRDGDAQYAGASFGVPLPVNPGKRTLKVEAPGRQEATVDLEIAEGEQKTVQVAPGEPLPAETTGAEQAAVEQDVPASAGDAGAERGSDTTVLGIVLGGVGVAGLGVGAVTGLMALSKQKTAEDNCSDALQACNQTGVDAASSGRTLALVSTIGWVVGALGVGAGAYFILTSDGDSGAETALGTEVGPGGARLSLHHRW